MGRFEEEIRKGLADNNLLQSDLNDLTGGIVTQSTISAIFRGAIPQKGHIIESLAGALGKDPKLLKKLAAAEIIHRKLNEIGVTAEEFCNFKKKEKQFKIPLYSIDELKDVLSDKGFPEKKAKKELTSPKDYGEYAYGFRVDDRRLYPRVWPGEICIVSQKYKVEKNDYGIVGSTISDKHILTGQINMDTRNVIVQTFIDYSTDLIRKKEIRFCHKIVGIYREE
jgi:hypothetical protein